jgi:hypothetical protein
VCCLFSEQYPIRLLMRNAYIGLSAANYRITTNKRVNSFEIWNEYRKTGNKSRRFHTVQQDMKMTI